MMEVQGSFGEGVMMEVWGLSEFQTCLVTGKAGVARLDGCLSLSSTL